MTLGRTLEANKSYHNVVYLALLVRCVDIEFKRAPWACVLATHPFWWVHSSIDVSCLWDITICVPLSIYLFNVIICYTGCNFCFSYLRVKFCQNTSLITYYVQIIVTQDIPCLKVQSCSPCCEPRQEFKYNTLLIYLNSGREPATIFCQKSQKLS